MAIPPNPLTTEMAEDIAAHILKRGGWEDCTPEKILGRATTYDELHKWWRIVRPGDKLPKFPSNPKSSDVCLITRGETSYQYILINGVWEMADAMPARLRDML